MTHTISLSRLKQTFFLGTCFVFGLAAFMPNTAHAQLCADTQVYMMDNVRTNYSLGYENFRNEDWCMALPYIKWILENDPFYSSTEPSERNYRRLAQTYEGLAQMAEDEAAKQTYVDSALVAYQQMDQVIAEQGFEVNEQNEKFARGRFYETNAEYFDDADRKAFDLYMEAYQMNPEETDDYYLNYLGRVTGEHAAAEEMDALEARDFIDELIALAEDPEYLEGMRATFRVEPIEQFADLLEDYRGGARDEDTVKRLFVMNVQLDSLIAEAHPELDRETLTDELFPIIIEFDPTAELLRARGMQLVRRGEIDEGIEYLMRSADMSEDGGSRAEVFYSIANTLYNAGQRGEAYRMAGRALEQDSNYGPALYIRALVVAGTVNSGTLRGRMAYWCVADMFSRAASAGGSTSAQARSLAGRYAASGPSREEYFFEGFRSGQSVTTSHGYGSCTTRVR